MTILEKVYGHILGEYVDKGFFIKTAPDGDMALYHNGRYTGYQFRQNEVSFKRISGMNTIQEACHQYLNEQLVGVRS